MRNFFSRTALAVAGFAGLSAPLHAAVVDVQFIHPDRYTDIGLNEVPANDAMGELQRYITRLGQALPATEKLTVEILDIDLAGRSQPVPRRPNDLRILNSIEPPRITLRYTLTEQGRTLASSQADLADLAYLDRPLRVNAPDRYPYEKRLLDEWFRSTFKTGVANAR